MTTEPTDPPEDDPPPKARAPQWAVVGGGLAVLLFCPLSVALTTPVNGLGAQETVLLGLCSAALAVPLVAWGVLLAVRARNGTA